MKTIEQIRESIKKIQVIPTKRHDRIKEVLGDIVDFIEEEILTEPQESEDN